MALTIAKQMRAALGQRQRVADGSQGVLHDPLATLRHMHIAAGHRGHAQLLRQRLQHLQAGAIVLFAMQFHCQKCTLAEHLLQPGALLCLRLHAGQPQRKYARCHIAKLRFHVGTPQAIGTLACRTPRGGDQPAHLRVTMRVFHQQHEAGSIDQGKFAADDQSHAGDARGFQATHDAGQRAFVGDGQGAVAAMLRACEQLLGTGGATQEREVRQAVQFGIRGHPIGNVRMADVVVGRAQACSHIPGARHAPAGGVAVYTLDGVIPAHGRWMPSTAARWAAWTVQCAADPAIADAAAFGLQTRYLQRAPKLRRAAM